MGRKRMRPADHLQRLGRLAEALQSGRLDGIYVPAANTLLATIKKRIQRDGKASSGNAIGSYSTRPRYYSKAAFVKKSAFKPVGKKGKREGAKTMYLPGGYKELRAVQGRPVNGVNLTYTGDLMASFKMMRGQNKILIGLDSEHESKKKEGLEKRYGKFLYGTRQELLEYHTQTREGVKKLSVEILNGSGNV